MCAQDGLGCTGVPSGVSLPVFPEIRSSGCDSDQDKALTEDE